MFWCCWYFEGEQKSDHLIKNKVLQAEIVFWGVKLVCGFCSKSRGNISFRFSRLIEGKVRKLVE